jgi:hypothetical protein
MEIITNAFYSAGLLASRLFAPLVKLFEEGGLRSAKCRAKTGRDFDDLSFTVFGVLRAIGDFESGRHALQSLPDDARAHDAEVPRATWFDALANSARLEGLQRADHALRRALGRGMPDQLAAFPELNDFEVMAGDGHWHAAAIHDAKDHLKRPIPVGHIYFKDLRTGLMSHHITCQAGTQEHDMKALERATTAALKFDRQQNKRRQTLVVYDRAAIKFSYWALAKGNHGVYLLTRHREDLVLPHQSHRPYDEANPINARVFSDRIVLADGKRWRLIEVAKSGSPDETIRILTNEMTLEPGLLGLLYQRRWDIERSYDCFKHKLKEGRAWASSETAKTAQAHFICLGHNLLSALEAAVELEGAPDVAEDARRSERTAERLAEERKMVDAQPKLTGILAFMNAKMPSPELLRSRKTTLGVKFLRWVRSYLFDRETAWPLMLARLAHYRASL